MSESGREPWVKHVKPQYDHAISEECRHPDNEVRQACFVSRGMFLADGAKPNPPRPDLDTEARARPFAESNLRYFIHEFRLIVATITDGGFRAPDEGEGCRDYVARALAAREQQGRAAGRAEAFAEIQATHAMSKPGPTETGREKNN